MKLRKSSRMKPIKWISVDYVAFLFTRAKGDLFNRNETAKDSGAENNIMCFS